MSTSANFSTTSWSETALLGSNCCELGDADLDVDCGLVAWPGLIHWTFADPVAGF